MTEAQLAKEAGNWLRSAREDLDAAQEIMHRDSVVPRLGCWLAQEAAQKALKAALVFAELPFPDRHDLDDFRNALPDGWWFKKTFPDLSQFTLWAARSRYPGPWEPLTRPEAMRAIERASRLFEAVLDDFFRRDIDIGDVS